MTRRAQRLLAPITRTRPGAFAPALAAASLVLIAPGCGALDAQPASSAQDSRQAAVGLPDSSTQRLLARAHDLADKGDLEASRKEFERLIATNPTLTVAYLGAGDIYRQQGDYKTAEKRYSKATELEPGNFDAQYLYGLVLQINEKISDAVRAYLKALSIRPDDFNANLNLGTAYLQLGEGEQALPYAQRAVKLDPDSAAARTNLGAIYASLKLYAEAVTEYQQAAELAQLSAPLLLNLADSLGRVGRYEEMANTLQQLIDIQETAEAYERLGSAQFRLRKYSEAETSFRRAIALDPRYYPAINGAAVCALNRYVWSNQIDESAKNEAIALFRQSLQIQKSQPQVIDLLSRYQ